jgi:transcriptional regulator with XRE-family HTH domain
LVTKDLFLQNYYNQCNISVVQLECFMFAAALKHAREQNGWTQLETARRMGVSQPYWALLESGKRPLPKELARNAVRVLGLAPTVLPPSPPQHRRVTGDELARALAALGYPGFAYVRSGWRKNPAEVLLTALQQDDLEARVTEALPWLLLRFPDMDAEWLVSTARLWNLSNRLGFVADLARLVAERTDGPDSLRVRRLAQLCADLSNSRLVREDTLCQASLSQAERDWLRDNRPQQAMFWGLLTNWRPEHLQHVG